MNNFGFDFRVNGIGRLPVAIALFASSILRHQLLRCLKFAQSRADETVQECFQHILSTLRSLHGIGGKHQHAGLQFQCAAD